MVFVDSVSKIVERYFGAVTLDPFEFRGKIYTPKKLRVSPSIFVRRMTCVAKCGACCTHFSLDYIPAEKEGLVSSYEKLQSRSIQFDGRVVDVWTDDQLDHQNHECRHLRMNDGRCNIHGDHPFSCDFELLRFYHFSDDQTPDRLDHRPYGRGWNMKRIDGERGALCEWRDQPCDKEWTDEIVRKLVRLQGWCLHFGVNSTLPKIMEWVRSGPHDRPLIVGPATKEGFDLG